MNSATHLVSAAHSGENKVKIAYFLFSAEVASPTLSARVTFLLNTGVYGNFIDMLLARSLGLDLAFEEHVLRASSELMQCASSRDILHINMAGHCFQEQVQAIPGLIYLLIVGVGWWRNHSTLIELS